MNKRIISFVMVVLMIVSLVPVTAMADNGASAGGTLLLHTYFYDNGVQSEREFSNYTFDVNSDAEIRICLHDADGSFTPIDPNELSLPAYLSIEEYHSDGWFLLKANAVGEGKVTYGDYSVEVNVHLPRMGIYSGMPFDETTVLGQLVLDEVQKVFYIALGPHEISEGNRFGNIIFTTPDPDDRHLDEVADIVISDDGTYCTVTVTDVR